MVLDVKENIGILSPYKPKRRVLGEIDHMIRIDDAIIKSVVFLCVDEHDKHGNLARKPKATGFFVRVYMTKSLAVDYVVTARHCVDKARNCEKLYVRFNLRDGTYAEIPTNPDDWHCHPLADVASILTPVNALPQGIDRQNVDQRSIEMDSFVGADYTYKVTTPTMKGKEIRPDVGHQVYYIGLSTEHYGQERNLNLPIARFGHIARRPGEVKMKLTGDVNFKGTAYLVELQSWGGSSGSPAFFLYPIMLETYGVDLVWVTGLLGLINGHYPFRQQAVRTEYSPDIEIDLNTGIAVVTPAEAIRQLLMEDEGLTEQRDKLIEAHNKNIPTPTLDIADTQESYNKNDFLQDLKKVSRRKSDQEQS